MTIHDAMTEHRSRTRNRHSSPKSIQQHSYIDQDMQQGAKKTWSEQFLDYADSKEVPPVAIQSPRLAVHERVFKDVIVI